MNITKSLIFKAIEYCPAFIRKGAKRILPKAATRRLIATIAQDAVLSRRRLSGVLANPRSVFPALEGSLWSSFGHCSEAELRRIWQDPFADRLARAYALWALARRSMAAQDHAQALACFYALRRAAPNMTSLVPFQLLEINALLSNGQAFDAYLAAQEALGAQNNDHPELLLAAANTIDAKDPNDDAARLAWVNRVLGCGALAPLSLRSQAQKMAIDNLCVPGAVPEDDCSAAKVSIIVPAFNAASTLRTALEGILCQTWRNLEVIVVDDASTDKTADVIRDFAEQDSRVKVIAHQTNSGAYAARNTGLAQATGDFVTVHDADDWSHPQKIALQVKDALENGSKFNVTSGVRVSQGLNFFTQPQDGRIVVVNMSSILYRRKDLVQLGGWDKVRFGGDAELYVRAQKYYSTPCKRIASDIPLTLILTSPGSLTQHSVTGKQSFHYGARREYREAFEYWHSLSDNLQLPEQGRAFPVPHIVRTRDPGALRYDILFVSDLTLPGGTTSSNMNMWQAAAEGGLKQAVWHWPRSENVSHPTQPRLRKLIHEGLIDVVVPGERIACDLVIVNHPNLLMTQPAALPQIECGACVVIFNQSPMTRRIGGRSAYDPHQALQNAERVFGVKPQAAPLSPLLRRILEDTDADIDLTPTNWTPLINYTQWRRHQPPDRTPHRLPVIGRHGRDHHDKWPDDVESLMAAYCVDAPVEVRILGGAAHAIAQLGRKPDNWNVLPFNSVDVASFLADLDFFVYFPHPDLIEAFGRAPMEAMATGVPVILPHHFRDTFGDAAVYAEPSDVPGIIQRLWNDHAEYRAQVDRGLSYVERTCSHESFLGRVSPYLTHDNASVAGSDPALVATTR
ncbi:glycosyltransferase [Microvirga sp. BSC39]|uniref:glycosyltransferase n=1 Tax=Microvirga sp. BSC39 TaxID=1549810 RepID=UPI0004E92FED|nr:glycosyltransferase [Microvirga sp. BSC39]KFG70226.1 hypothetical protein JH26_05690 [Microvirga sp. BSC39]